VLTRDGPLSLRNEKHRMDFGPIEESCGCTTCRLHSRAYLRHLFKAKEIQAAVLATYHNLFFTQRLVEEIRSAITAGTFAIYKDSFLSRYERGEG
jgi:queuine tRNA-ribosyltransferase